jgi:hypothetical protein
MSTPDLLAAIGPVVDALEDLGVPYYLGGSVASSLHGVARTTLDVDVIADIRGKHVTRFVSALGGDYYVSEPMIRDAILHRSSFNVIHLSTAFKVDVFVPKDREFDQAAFDRIRRDRLGDPQSTREIFVASPEDVVLNKLEWYRKGCEVSERQWNDALGVLQVQAQAIDFEYLRKWAAVLNIDDLLERMLEQARLNP